MTQKNQENTTEQKYFIDEDLDFPQESTDFKNLLDNRIKQSSSSNIEALATGKTLEGTIVGIGYNHDLADGMFVRIEGNLMDFDDVTLKNTVDTNKSVTASDIEGYGARLSVGKSF